MELKPKETIAACVPRLLVSVINKLSPAQTAKVKDLGFGGILQLKSISLRMLLCMYLADSYDTQRDIFKINKYSVAITTWDVVCIMGIKDEGKKIKDNKQEPNEILFKSYADPESNQMTFLNLANAISDTEDPDEHFIRRFMLLMIGTLLAPKIKNVVPKRYLNLVENVAEIPKLNWAEFTRDELIKGIKAYKKDKKKCFGGNLVLLLVWYFEHFRAPSAGLNDNRNHPLIGNWDESRIDKRHDYDMDNGKGSGKFVLCLTDSEKDNCAKSGCNSASLDNKSSPKVSTDSHKVGIESLEERVRSIEENVSYVPIIYDMLKKLLQASNTNVRCKSNDEEDLNQKEIKQDLNDQKEHFDKKEDLDHDVVISSGHNSLQINNDETFSKERKEGPIPDLNESILCTNDEEVSINCKDTDKYSIEANDNNETFSKERKEGLIPKKSRVKPELADSTSKCSLLVKPKISRAVGKSSAIDVFVLKFIGDYSASSPQEILVQSSGITLSASTLSRLVAVDGWLCDKIMDCYIRLIDMSRMRNDKVLVANTTNLYTIKGLAKCELTDQRKEFAMRKGREIAQCDMVFFPMNYMNIHWFVGVLNLSKQEFQILNSLPAIGPPYEESTQPLREGLSIILQLLSSSTDIVLPFKQLDVCKWPICVADNIPLQNDDYACGVFSLKYMQFWNGCNLVKRFSQVTIWKGDYLERCS